MKVIILAGGGGSRLFPLSRASQPKQFLALEDDASLLAHTIRRFLTFVSASDLLIVTNAAYRDLVQNELAACGASDAHIVCEPAPRSTAPAIALALLYAEERLESPQGETYVVAASDHVIRPDSVFAACIRRGAAVAQDGCLVTFGVPAKSPETGYGYIEVGAADGDAYEVASFREKPDAATAERYVSAGRYFWNSGLFAFTGGFLRSELAACEPAIASAMDTGLARFAEQFAALPAVSIDCAVAERSRCVRMVPLTCYWNDIGSWDAVWDILPKDLAGNATRGDVLAQDCKDSLLWSRSRLLVAIGLQGILLVETPDAIVAIGKGASQHVKDAVETLRRQGRKEPTATTDAQESMRQFI